MFSSALFFPSLLPQQPLTTASSAVCSLQVSVPTFSLRRLDSRHRRAAGLDCPSRRNERWDLPSTRSFSSPSSRATAAPAPETRRRTECDPCSRPRTKRKKNSKQKKPISLRSFTCGGDACASYVFSFSSPLPVVALTPTDLTAQPFQLRRHRRPPSRPACTLLAACRTSYRS